MCVCVSIMAVSAIQVKPGEDVEKRILTRLAREETVANDKGKTMTTRAVSPEAIVILIGAAVALLVILILLLTRKLGVFLLIAGGLAVAFIFGRAMWSQAQATQETAVAAQEAARAATVSSVGQTAGNVAVTVLAVALVIVVILAVGAVAFFWLQARRTEKRASRAVERGWVAGPNARWERREAHLSAMQQSNGGVEALLPLLIGQMQAMQTMMMTLMQQQSGWPSYPGQWGTSPSLRSYHHVPLDDFAHLPGAGDGNDVLPSDWAGEGEDWFGGSP
jgi:hypothetical protein